MGTCCSSPSTEEDDFSNTVAPPEGTGKNDVKESIETQDAVFGLSKDYQLGKALGSGACGEVWLMTSRTSGDKLAVKVMRRPISKKYEQRVLREIKIHGNVGCNHPNIVSGYEVLLTASHLSLTMEYAEGGTMLDYVLGKCKLRHSQGELAPILDEDEARFFFHQLINAVEHIHNALVAHRDLKLENTLLSYLDVDGEMFPTLKICDFGFANYFEADAILFTNLGTPPYMSPEVIRSNDGYSGIAADVWSCGVFLYAMLMGTFPFKFQDSGNDTMEFRDLWIQQTKYKWDDQKHTKRLIRFISPEAKDMLDQIFQPDKQARVSIPKIRQHPWMLKPLSAKYQKCIDKLQAIVGEQASSLADSNPPNLGKLPSISFRAGQVQDDKISQLVSAACSKGEPGETLSVALGGPSVPPTMSGLTTVCEDLMTGGSKENFPANNV